MKKIIKYFIFALLAAGFVWTFVFLFKKSRPEPEQYQEIEVTRGDIRKTTVVTGKITPRNEVNIKPQINGIIAELCKEAGQTVVENEVIAKLKVIPDMNSLSSAQSRVRLSEINLKQAQTNFDREKALYEQKLVSADEYEKVAQALNQAKEERAAAQDALEVIRDGVSSTNATGSTTLVRSTISGLILDVPVKVGNSVILSNSFNDGTTIATVADMSNLIFRGNIDETEVGRIVEGMPVSITVGAVQDLKMAASLEYISPKGRESNGANQFEIKAALSVPDSVTLRSGYGANAEIVLERAKKAVCVPEAALEFKGDSIFVYVLTDSVPKQVFDRRQVVTGLSNGIDIEVKSGVKVGEMVRGILKEEKKK